MRKISALFLIFSAFFALVAWPAASDACIGKTLYLGRLPGRQQEILAEIFVWLVSERTGTSIEVKPFGGSRETHQALEEAKIDLYLEETAVALREILGEADAAAGGGDQRALVKQEYQKRFNLVWLEPWGLQGGGGEAASPVAPVVRRDTLKKFPALSRLINKLAGVVDDRAMAQLVAESADSPVRDVTKKFLKSRKLI